MTALDLGSIFAITSLVFAFILYIGFRKQSWLNVLIGKYGMILLLLLASLQMNIDTSYTSTQASLGFFIAFLVSLMLLLIIIDLAFFIIMILPRKRRGQGWRLIMFGKV